VRGETLEVRRGHSGQVAVIEVNSNPLYDPHKRVRGAVTVERDVTERTRLQQQVQTEAERLEQADERLRGLLEADHDVLAMLEPALAQPAAEHLVRVPGMILLVDGYNVSLQAWPDVPIPEQRRRLVDALSAVAARTGVDAQVIFDGAEQPEPRSSGLPPRSAVRVRFSPPDVDADEVLIELTEELPPARPVTVATSE